MGALYKLENLINENWTEKKNYLSLLRASIQAHRDSYFKTLLQINIPHPTRTPNFLFLFHKSNINYGESHQLLNMNFPLFFFPCFCLLYDEESNMVKAFPLFWIRQMTIRWCRDAMPIWKGKKIDILLGLFCSWSGLLCQQKIFSYWISIYGLLIVGFVFEVLVSHISLKENESFIYRVRWCTVDLFAIFIFRDGERMSCDWRSKYFFWDMNRWINFKETLDLVCVCDKGSIKIQLSYRFKSQPNCDRIGTWTFGTRIGTQALYPLSQSVGHQNS